MSENWIEEIGLERPFFRRRFLAHDVLVCPQGAWHTDTGHKTNPPEH